jgi:hypothetical protein
MSTMHPISGMEITTAVASYALLGLLGEAKVLASKSPIAA